MCTNDLLANYTYDMTGNLAFAFGCFAATASLAQIFKAVHLGNELQDHATTG
jgi:hypothetical protein